MMKDTLLSFLHKLKAIYPKPYSFMAILINSLHSKAGLKDLEQQSQLSKIINCMVEVELMMDTLLMG